MSARARQAGFTLTELLVGVAISIVIAAGALTLLVSMQRAYHDSADDRLVQDEARVAIAELSQNLRRAGYGIEPWLAFDFGAVTNAPPSWVGGPQLVTGGYPAGAPGAQPPSCATSTAFAARDSTSGSDEIVFMARDPAFRRTLAAVPSAGSLTLDAPLTAPMYSGQILQVMCSGASAWAYVTVGATVAAGATQVPLSTGCTGFPFQQDMLTTNACFTIGWATARVFKIERFHYYVARFADANSGAQRPYLMLDRGLWDGSTPLVDPIAPDVEDVQFGYVFPRSAAANQLVGATPGTAIANAAGSIDLASVPPAYTDLSTAASRSTNHPGNIRGVRVSVVVRQPLAKSQWVGNTAYQTIPAAQNRDALTGSGVDAGYQRVLVETTEAIRNLDARGPYYPAYSTSTPLGADGLNVNGG